MKVSIVELDGKEYLRIQVGLFDLTVPMKKVLKAFKDASFKESVT